jgi:hypothetical protein
MAYNRYRYFRLNTLAQGSQTRGPHVARQVDLCGPRSSQKLTLFEIFINFTLI